MPGPRVADALLHAPLPLWRAAASRHEPVDDGEIAGEPGRRPMWAGDLITDGRGMLYMVGRWGVSEADMQTIGILRHKMRMAVFFCVIDVRGDLRRMSGQG